MTLATPDSPGSSAVQAKPRAKSCLRTFTLATPSAGKAFPCRVSGLTHPLPQVPAHRSPLWFSVAREEHPVPASSPRLEDSMMSLSQTRPPLFGTMVDTAPGRENVHKFSSFTNSKSLIWQKEEAMTLTCVTAIPCNPGCRASNTTKIPSCFIGIYRHWRHVCMELVHRGT